MATEQGSLRIGSEASDRWGWRSVHISYHDVGGQDDLLLDAVRPLFARLGACGVRAYFLRHWRRGPRLRLHVHTDWEMFATLVRPAIDDVVGTYLRAHPSTAHPSTAHLDPAALLPVHKRLAEREAEERPLVPWYPDNTIRQAARDPRVAVLGSWEAADLLDGEVGGDGAAGDVPTPLDDVHLLEDAEHGADGVDGGHVRAAGVRDSGRPVPPSPGLSVVIRVRGWRRG
jgi:hypothetical protein